jgi:hypothetical protein
MSEVIEATMPRVFTSFDDDAFSVRVVRALCAQSDNRTSELETEFSEC